MSLETLTKTVESRGFACAVALTTLDRNRVTRAELYDQFVENDTLIEYGHPESVTVSEPDGYAGKIPGMDRWRGRYTVSKPFVGVVHDAHLVGSPPLAVTESGYVADASVSPNVQTLNVINSVRESPKRIATGNGRREDIDEAVLLHNSWDGGYFHWVAETLTRLEGVEQYTAETGRTPKLIVGPDLNSYQLETLELLGYDSDDLIRWDATYCQVDRLVVPAMRREINPPSPSPFSHQWLRESLREQALRAVDTSRFSDRVYISRNDATSRRVRNERDAFKRLEHAGFERYELSSMAVKETIALFAQADCIVTPHGAGLTDLIYADNVSVVELMPINRVNGIYYMLTKQVDGWYGYIGCETNESDLIVDVDDLEAMVDAALARDSVGQLS
ncbi:MULTISPECIES: glycosyltransferase family 61 protein [Natronorubrum]|uniref:Capsular polysaccharide biosynthesis protein-like protein n=2 Tax=Natronorubrum bangense TaxID=61858 RepID=L9W769_9EURY|nr:glycosyltransferase family 61 protein [Natronorubrum bangense]ELY45340.1 Capsular polysaccharide biosynthesis protein- like protein [Natronorubrum bangense JCM 10635]QCC56815.1 glycosyltransferase family 61 protein [Natronorubrum bangense]